MVFKKGICYYRRKKSKILSWRELAREYNDVNYNV